VIFQVGDTGGQTPLIQGRKEPLRSRGRSRKTPRFSVKKKGGSLGKKGGGTTHKPGGKERRTPFRRFEGRSPF